MPPRRAGCAGRLPRVSDGSNNAVVNGALDQPPQHRQADSGPKQGSKNPHDEEQDC